MRDMRYDMRHVFKPSSMAGLFLSLAFLWCCGGPPPEPRGLKALLPDEVGGWKKHGPALVYSGDDLFTYINGGAEIYHEFGFEEVIVQDYRSDEGGTISLEIYEMTGPESAFGIYTFKRSPDGLPLDYPGAAAQLEDYYLNLWKGAYLLTLTGFDEEASTIQGLRDLARSLSFRLSESGRAPELVGLLPEKDLRPGSVKYFNGPLALFNSHGFAREDVFSLERGVRGDYAGGESLFIFAYEDPERAEAAFKRAEEFFAAAPDHEVTRSPEGERFHMQDSKGGFFRLERIEGFVLIAGGPEPSGDAAPLLVEARTRVTGR